MGFYRGIIINIYKIFKYCYNVVNLKMEMFMKKILCVIITLLMLFTMCACEKSQTFTVTFDSLGGSAVESQIVNRGNCAIKPDAPMKEGFTFVEWQYEGEAYNFSNPVKCDILLTAFYVINEGVQSIPIVFNSNNGEQIKVVNIAKGSTVGQPPTPKKEGYKFVGWFLDSTQFNFDTVLEKSITLVAKWVVDKLSSNESKPNETNKPNTDLDSNLGDNKPIPSKKYGVRWKIDDPDDFGSRCFDAEDKTIKIGVGSMDGYSDFDDIYPWSGIQRCKIISKSNGTQKIVYEGEKEFNLDTTDGDIFVRIPKFYVEQYVEDGYEYRVISATGDTLHPAFIENGKELNEIFVSAFEGYVDDSDKLRSIAGVIPTNNITAEEFLFAAKKNGNNYSLYDSRCVDAIWTLMAVEFGGRNTNKMLGYGVADYKQPSDYEAFRSIKNEKSTNSITIRKMDNYYISFMPINSNITICCKEMTNIVTQARLLKMQDSDDGLYTTIFFDGEPVDIDDSCFVGSAPLHTNFSETCQGALSWHTGRANFITGENSKTQNPIRYRWIENIYGNLWQYLPDITFDNLQMYVCKNMADYNIASITGGYKPIGQPLILQKDNGKKPDVVGSNYWITSLIDATVAKNIPFGDAFDTSLNSTQAFGAYYYLADERRIIANGGGFDHLYRCNILTQRAWIKTDTKWYLYGARLMYKNIS